MCRAAAERKVSAHHDRPGRRSPAAGELTLQRVERKVRLGADAPGQRHLQVRVAQEGSAVLKETAAGRARPPATRWRWTAHTGQLQLRVRDAAGLELNRIDYSVAGKGNVSRSLERNAELQLTLNKKDYAPGEEIEVSIRAPYVGAGLITIERDKVYAQQWFKTTRRPRCRRSACRRTSRATATSMCSSCATRARTRSS
jgi:uncharacterized protein YfaS (alpha-2-macroglobulin family)